VRALFYRLNPAVPQHWLLLFAGILWTCVGGFLCFRAFGWIEFLHETSASIYFVLGIAIAIAGNRFVFSGIAHKNVSRILRLPQRACAFAFTGWRGYGMIAVMSVAGVLMRNSSLPKQYLATLYAAMGGALILASVVFYNSFWKMRVSNEG
jgi:hypothetical protein